jgi:hypothetical protein
LLNTVCKSSTKPSPQNVVMLIKWTSSSVEVFER